MPESESTDTLTQNYVVQSRFFVLIAFLLSFVLILVCLLYFWYTIGLDILFGVESPSEKGLTSYIPSLIYLLFAMIVSIVMGLLSTIYFEKVVAYVYSVALDRNARDYKLKKKWFRGIAITCAAIVLLTHIVAGGSIISYIDSLISTSHPRNYRRSLVIGLGGLWLFISFLVEISIITALRTIGIDAVEEVNFKRE